MNLPRRRFLHLAAGAAALSAVSRVARAQAYPTRPVRIIVGFADQKTERRRGHRRSLLRSVGRTGGGAVRSAIQNIPEDFHARSVRCHTRDQPRPA